MTFKIREIDIDEIPIKRSSDVGKRTIERDDRVNKNSLNQIETNRWL